jgi:ubiquinone/menaquinone biosynthesis C-methylase UbiE
MPEMDDLQRLYRDPVATTGYWEQSWGSRNYDQMLAHELYNSTFRATVDTLVAGCHLTDRQAVLDIGCGWGRLIIGLLKRFPGLQIQGIDVSSEAVSRGPDLIARETGRRDIRLQVARAESLPFDDASFAAIVSSRVFQYVSEPITAMREIHRVLKPGGEVTILAPNKRNPVRYFRYHTQLLTSDKLTEWMEAAGLEVTGTGSIVYWPPSWKRFSDESFWVSIDRWLAKAPIVRRMGGLAWASARKPRQP